jgi:acyl-CoA synthetase (AMP-forming)/AMP-acid ligase II
LIFDYIDRYRVNYMTAVPEIYELLWRCRQMAPDLSSLQLLFSGGSCLSAELYHKIYKDFGVYLAHGYGLTEFTPVSRNSANHNRAGTVGPICSGVEVKIDDPAPDGSGEILFETKGMARGYYRRPAETEEVFSNGWFRTGDLGHIENGYLVFDREKKNTRKVNGNMVDLKEVERTLQRYGGIVRSNINVRDNILRANVLLDWKCNFNEEIPLIRQFLKQNLSSYKIPRRIGQLL